MTRIVEDMLGRDYTFSHLTNPGVVQTIVTLIAYDPARGYRFWSATMNPAWVPVELFDRLIDSGLLAEA